MHLRLFVGIGTLVLVQGCGSEPPDIPIVENISQKIDAPLNAAARPDARVPVLILGRTQLLSGADAFREFTATPPVSSRSALRNHVIAELKRIASTDRASLIDPSWPAAAEPIGLWIINGVLAKLTKPEIEAAAASQRVAYLYLLGSHPPRPHNTISVAVTPARHPFNATGKQASWNLVEVGAVQAWAQGITGEGMVVALIDASVALNHSDLVNNVWVNEDEIANNNVDDDRNGYVDDRHGFNFEMMSADNGRPTAAHGTFVAGIIAGDGSAGVITGIAPRARIMPLVGISFAETALALQYALEQGADVVNMSFSLGNQGNLRGAWRMVADHSVIGGLVLVSGAGNFQQQQPIPVQLRTPEDIPSVIAVGGVDASLVVTAFSSLGPVEWGTVRFFGDHPMPTGLIKPDVAAFPGPGYAILNVSGGYIDPNVNIRGNSFSSPHVAGAAALLLSLRPETPAWKISEVLQSTARDIGTSGKDNQTGSGLIDIAAAIQRLR